MKSPKSEITILKEFITKIRTDYITSRDMNAFVQSLKKQKVNFVVDIRWATYYKSNQGFKPQDFKEHLKKENIEYLYFEKLGNPYHKWYDHLTEHAIAEKDYLHHLKNSKAQEEFLKLFDKISTVNKIFCLICYCNTLNPKGCHRFWLKKALISEMKRTSNQNIKDSYPQEEVAES